MTHYIKHSILIIFGVLPTLIMGQNEEDVYRYSQLQFGGSARSQGVAGAFGAIGADFSVLSTNPAGMGRYRESDFSFTPTINFSSNQTDFKGNVSNDSKQNFNFNNIGIVAVTKANAESPSLWRAVQFGFGYNRLANFNNRYTIEGVSNNSLSKVLAVNGFYIDELELNTLQPFGAGPAYSTWLIDPYDASGKTIYTTQMYVDSVFHSHRVTTKGGIGEWVFALSGNYNEKLYIGGSLGFQKINYQSETVHSEASLIDTTSLSSFSYTENLTTKGNGVNLKLGTIFLPVKFLRIGLAYHSGTNYYNMVNNYNTVVETNFNDVTLERDLYNYTAASPLGVFRYKMRTPNRILGSLAIVVKKKGLISVDYEYLDYRKGFLKQHPFSNDSYTFTAENEKVKTSFRQAGNLRVGAEYRLTNIVMLRGGFAIMQNGYNPELVAVSKPIMMYSFGIGYRAKSIYIDAAYTITQTQQDYYMYDPYLVENTQINRSISNIYTTIGFKF